MSSTLPSPRIDTYSLAHGVPAVLHLVAIPGFRLSPSGRFGVEGGHLVTYFVGDENQPAVE